MQLRQPMDVLQPVNVDKTQFSVHLDNCGKSALFSWLSTAFLCHSPADTVRDLGDTFDAQLFQAAR